MFGLIDISLQKFFKVKNIPNLRCLGDTKTMPESFPAVICEGILGSVSKATKHEIAADESTSSAFACITVDYHYVLRGFQ